MENDAIAIQRLEEEKNRMREMLVTVEGEKRDMLAELKDRKKEFNNVQIEVSELQFKLEKRIDEKIENEKHLNDNIEQLRKKIEEQQQRHDDISREALHYKSSVNDLEIDLRETKLELKKVKKHSAEQTIDQNKRYDELESVSAAKDSEIDKLLKELTLVKRESMSMNEKYENTAVELKHVVEAKAVMEQQFTEDNNSLRKELQKQVYSSISFWKVHLHLKIEIKICKMILTRWKNTRSVLKHN